jgi:hypothetical protein
MKDNFTVYDLLVHSKNVYDVDFRDNKGVIYGIREIWNQLDYFLKEIE